MDDDDMSDDGDTSAMPWQLAKSKNMKRPNQMSTSIARKMPMLSSEQCTSSNRFAVLSSNKDNEDTIQNNNNEFGSSDKQMTSKENSENQFDTPKPPPIFLSDVSNISGMLAYIDKCIKKTEYNYKCQANNHVRVMVKSVEEYRKLIKSINDDCVKYHTCQLKQERAFRVVIKNLHWSTNIAFIKSEIESKGHIVRNISNIKSRVTKEPLSLFFVDIEPENKNTEIYDLRHIGNAIVTVEPTRKVKDIVQCYRCQEFGHTKSYCTKMFRCVKCSMKHSSTTCPKEKNSPAKCANCLENHAASYKGCRVYQEILLKKSATKRTNNMKNINDTNNNNAKSANYAQPYTFIPPQQYANQPSYAQVVTENYNSNSSLERIEELLRKQSELTNNLLNMIMLLVNKLCN